MLVLQNAPDMPISIPGLKMSSEEIHTGTAKFDLTLSLKETDSGISGTLEFNTDIFDSRTIVRVIEHYGLVLEAMVASPETPIGRLSMLTAAEEQQLLLRWNDTHRDYLARCATSCLQSRHFARPRPSRAVSRQIELTYGELNARAEQLSRYLLELGVGPGWMITLCIERSPEMLVAILGIWKSASLTSHWTVKIPSAP